MNANDRAPMPLLAARWIVSRRLQATHSGGRGPRARLRRPTTARQPHALAGRRQERLRRRGVAVLLQEVVLDLPDVVVAEAVGQLDLVQRVLQQPVLGARLPWPG